MGSWLVLGRAVVTTLLVVVVLIIALHTLIIGPPVVDWSEIHYRAISGEIRGSPPQGLAASHDLVVQDSNKDGPLSRDEVATPVVARVSSASCANWPARMRLKQLRNWPGWP
jgi:hypothetical protein